MKNINWKNAIGEILIVIIGITIAFSLNKWWDSRAERETEIRYLANIKKDIEKDQEALDIQIANANEANQLTGQILGHLNRKNYGLDTLPFMIFKLASNTHRFSPHNSTFESLKASGDLKLIQNFDLKNKMVEFYADYNEVHLANERYEHFVKSYLGPFFVNEIDYSKMMSPQGREFLKDPLLHNMMMNLFGIYKIQKEAYESAKAGCKEMIKEIEKEL